MSKLINALSGENPWINTSYFFHGFAANQADDSKFRDISGNPNDGAFGANLSIANAWATAGYVSTVDPTGGATDSVIRIPAVNLDYNAGESLLFWWLGRITPEGSAVEFAGDGGFNTTYPGWGIRVNTAGTAQIKLSDATNTYFSATSSGTAFIASTLKSIGILIKSNEKKAYLWIDDALDSNFTSGSTLNSGNAIDTRTTNTVNIGTTLPASAASTTGIVTQTRACAILKFGVGQAVPTSAQITNAFAALRRNPSRPLLKTAFS